MSDPTLYRFETSVPVMVDSVSTAGSVHRTKPSGDAQGDGQLIWMTLGDVETAPIGLVSCGLDGF